MSNPMISVVMPVFNGEKHLGEAIDSILEQSYKDFEFIILNDGSTDKTEEIILSYSDPRIVYIKNEQNLQIVKTLNKGITLAKGRYIARMDADDISLPKRFEKQLNFMEVNNNIGVCGTWLQTFGSRNEFWKFPEVDEEIKATLIFHSNIAHPSVMIRKSVFETISYNDKFYGAEDYALWVELLKKTQFYNFPEVLIKYRLHESKTDKKTQLNSANELRKIMLQNIRCTLENKDLNIFFDLARYHRVNINDSERVFNKIAQGNEVSRVIEKKALVNIIMKKRWEILNNQSQYNLSTFRALNVFYLQKKINISFLSYLKFFIKCLLIYRNR